MNRNRLKTCRSSIVEGEKQELLTHTVELEYMCSSLISSAAFKQRGETETLWSAGAALSLDSLLYDCGGSQTGKGHRIGRPTARSRTTTDCLEENQGAARRLRVLFLRGLCPPQPPRTPHVPLEVLKTVVSQSVFPTFPLRQRFQRVAQQFSYIPSKRSKSEKNKSLTTSVGRKYLGSTLTCTTPVSWQRPISCSSLPSHLQRRKS